MKEGSLAAGFHGGNTLLNAFILIGSASPKKSGPPVTAPPEAQSPVRRAVEPSLSSSVFLETNEEEIYNTGMMY